MAERKRKNCGENKDVQDKAKTQENSSPRKTKYSSFSTMSGHPLTPKEAAFIDKYLETGNQTQAYLEAYPDTKESLACQCANRLKSKPYVAEEIRARLELARAKSIATAEEVMQYFTGVMRGEIKDQFGLDAGLGERTKAAQELAKRLIDIPNKAGGSEPPTITIKLDWDRDGFAEGNE